MKIKYEDLQRLMKKLEKHSKKGNLDITVSSMGSCIYINYVSNLETETTITIYDADLQKFVTINESQWLND